MQGWTLIPMVVLATAATVIASQAVISGAFSLTRQAVQLNMLPRLEIQHTSETQSGQIYMPRVNLLLALSVMLLVVGFGEFERARVGLRHLRHRQDADDDGPAVRGHAPASGSGSWRRPFAGGAVFGFIDIGFFVSNIVKVFDGGWVSSLVAADHRAHHGDLGAGARAICSTRPARTRSRSISWPSRCCKKPPMLVPGTAVFLTSDPQSAPTALMHSLKHYKVLHEQNVILSVVTAQQPTVPDSEQVRMEKINDLFMRVTLTFGYMEQPNIPKALAICRKQGWKFDIMTTSFFLSRRR